MRMWLVGVFVFLSDDPPPPRLQFSSFIAFPDHIGLTVMVLFL